MLFLNESEIDAYRERYRNHPVLGKATRFLSDLRDEVNQKSDGWAYWGPPVRSAAKLMTLIKDGRLDPNTATEEALKKAITPIKSFCTRYKVTLPTLG